MSLETNSELVTSRKKLRIYIVLLVVCAAVLSYGIYAFMASEEAEKEQELSEIKEQLEDLSYLVKVLNKDKRLLNHQRDSLKQNVDYLWPMRNLVHNAKLRDKVGGELAIKPGQVVRLKTDSSRVVITDIIVGGNDYNYFLHYLIKNNKGETKEVSPYELEVPPTN
jgi:hypothetical protein